MMNCICKAFSCECISAIAAAASVILAIIMVGYNRKVISENQKIAMAEFRFNILQRAIVKYIPIFKILEKEIDKTFKEKVHECFNKLDFKKMLLSKVALGGKLASAILEMDKSIKGLDDVVDNEEKETILCKIEDIKNKKYALFNEIKASFLVAKGIDISFFEYDSIDALIFELQELAGIDENE